MNLRSIHAGAWSRFARYAPSPGAAEAVVDCERLAIQFLGDYRALDRLEMLAVEFSRCDSSCRAALVRAQVASLRHRFEEARGWLVFAQRLGASIEEILRNELSIDQACGVGLEAVLTARLRCATRSPRIEDRVPLGALLADLERFEEADLVYQEAFYSFCGVSPFPLAWVCFQLGVLWGEVVPVPDSNRAERWYRQALDYLPAYVNARVHLAEICTRRGHSEQAERLLRPALSSWNPEVPWRLAEALEDQGKFTEAQIQVDAARSAFETLLDRHPLAFADHAAEFFAGSGADRERARKLARMNCENRATRDARSLMESIGVALLGRERQ